MEAHCKLCSGDRLYMWRTQREVRVVIQDGVCDGQGKCVRVGARSLWRWRACLSMSSWGSITLKLSRRVLHFRASADSGRELRYRMAGIIELNGEQYTQSTFKHLTNFHYYRKKGSPDEISRLDLGSCLRSAALGTVREPREHLQRPVFLFLSWLWTLNCPREP